MAHGISVQLNPHLIDGVVHKGLTGRKERHFIMSVSFNTITRTVTNVSHFHLNLSGVYNLTPSVIKPSQWNLLSKAAVLFITEERSAGSVSGCPGPYNVRKYGVLIIADSECE